MTAIELFGTVTSPYVRRVRIVLDELGLTHELVNTADAPGQIRLRQVNPVWKVPTLKIDDRVLLDSAVILRYLLHRFGTGELRPCAPTDWEQVEQLTVIDGALDALINVFYLGKEGVTPDRAPYLQKQRDRASSALSWLEERVKGPWLSEQEQLGLPEIGLVTALGWMNFREAYPVERHPKLVAFMQEHAARPSIASTAPLSP